MPATKAPTIGASCARSASSANASVNAKAIATTVPGDRETRSMAENSGGATRSPTTLPRTRKSTATAMIPRTDSRDTDPSVTSRTTTVSTTRPMTSSATAAPRTTRASWVASARRSPKTRAVMPTLVAVRAAPTKSAVLNSSPMIDMAASPRTNGATTPIVATCSEVRPTLPSSLRSISRPTSSRRRMTPISPRVLRTSLPSPTAFSSDGPMMMPAMISPTTAGMPMRSETSAASLAATSTISRLRRISAVSMRRRQSG